MLDNVESNQPTETNKPIVDTVNELKVSELFVGMLLIFSH